MQLIFFLLAGLILLYFGAEWLVKGSSSLALRFGVPPLVVGLTIVAFGTSAPEMVVSIKAGLEGLGAIAIGNVVGSNIFNIAIILGLAAMVRPFKVNLQVLRVDTPIMVGVSILFFYVLRDGTVNSWEAALLFAGILIYNTITVYLGKRSIRQMPKAEAASIKVKPSKTLLTDIIFIIMGLAALVLGSNLFVEGAIALAQTLHVSQAVIGLTIVACGTSLPELATTIVAVVKKQEDIAIGNIIGSNIFNILAIVGVSGLIRPIHSQGVGMVDLSVMLGLAVILIPLMWFRYKLGRLEGALLILSYCGYLWYLLPVA